MTMTAPTTATPIADATVDRPAWLDERGEGVTASEVHAIATGGRSTWRRILDDKLNGSTFKGNKHTRRGNERERFILSEVAAMPAVESLTPNSTLFAHAKHALHRATPDAFLIQVDGIPAGVEVKSRAHGWDVTKIPADAADQCQWGMHVTGLDLWYFVTEVMGQDGEPTLADPTVALIARDEQRIRELVRAADEFIAWRESGAPDDTLPDDELDAIRRWNAAKQRVASATEEAKALEKQVRKIIADHPTAETEGWKFANDTAGGFTYSVTTTETTVIDEDDWKQDAPESYAELLGLRAEAADAAAEIENLETWAREHYGKPVTKTSTRLLPVAPKGSKR